MMPLLMMAALRAHAVDCTVLNDNDSGLASLRDCLVKADTSGDIIDVVKNVATITPITEFPPLQGGVTLKGGGVRLDGSSAGFSHGLIVGGDGAVVRGLVVEGFQRAGIKVSGTNATVGGTTSAMGNVLVGNGRSGVLVEQSATGATIGNNVIGLDGGLAAGNCVAPSTYTCAGIWLLADDAEVRDNTVAFTQGVAAYSQGAGIFASGGDNAHLHHNTVGIDGANSTHGIAVAAPSSRFISGAIVEHNVVGNNGSTGITIGTNTGLATVADNTVGFEADGLTAAGNTSHGIHLFSSDEHTVRDNRVGHNTGAGIRISGSVAGATGAITGNTVGIGSDGSDAGNGTWGIRSTGGAGYLIQSNVVGFNDDGGIYLGDDDHRLLDNHVGTDAGGGDRGNDIGGVWVAGDRVTVQGNELLYNHGAGLAVEGNDVQVLDNLVGHNDAEGVVVFAPSGASTSGVELASNRIGVDATDTATPNGGHGLHFGELGAYALSDVEVRDNLVHHNGDKGIRVEAGDRIRLRANSVTDNSSCGVLVEPTANGGLITPPHLEYLTPQVAVFEVDTPPPGTDVVAVHVFWDPVDEARDYLGTADSVDDNLYEMRRPFRANGGRVSAIVEWSDGNTSGLAGYCADGCGNTADSTCNDGNPCTLDQCGATGCTFDTTALNGSACSDGSACSTNDQCQNGTCVGADSGCASDRCEETVTTASGQQYTAYRVCDDSADFCAEDRCHPDDGCVQVDVSPLCDDGNDCTLDSCDAASDACVNTPQWAGMVCDDHSNCTGWGTCDGAGLCVDVDPEPPCVDLSCNPATCDELAGCTYPSTCGNASCDAEDLCNGGCPTECDVKSTEQGADEDDDNDGIPDEWEFNGGYTDCNGVFHPLIGASFEVTDIYLEIDYMMDGPHTHEPLPGVTADVIFAFNFAGDALHIEVDEALPHHQVIRMGSHAPKDTTCTDWIPFDKVKQDYFDPGRRPAYHYAVMAHEQVTCGNGSSGYGETLGNDFYVTLAQWDNQVGTYDQQRGTLMHELGHNLDLRHGGDENTNFKPNYFSVMRYGLQMGMLEYVAGAPPGWAAIDYEWTTRPTLDESALVELDGVTQPSPAPNSLRYYSLRGCVDKDDGPAVPPEGPVDWDCDNDRFDTGPLEPYDTGLVAWDVNGDGKLTQLTGANDWDNLRYQFQCESGGDYADGSPRDDAAAGEELDWQTAYDLGILYPPMPVTLDLAPGCAQDQISQTGSAGVQVAVLGSADLDVTTIDASTLRLAGRPLIGSVVENVDGDDYDDLVAEFRGRPTAVAGPWLMMEGRRTNSQRIVGSVQPQWIASSDADADAVEGACDLCPTQTAPVGDLDGCP